MIEPDAALRLRDRLVALTRDLVLMPSAEQNPTAIRQCYEFVRHHLEEFEGVEIQDFVDDGVPSLVALPASGEPADVLMVAHLDVVHHADVAAYRSVIENGRIIGPGAGDMKGQLAILMVLFRRFHRAMPGVRLGLAVTTDEETGGAHGVGYLVNKRGLRCGLALIPDGGSLQEITIEEKGILHLRVTAKGTTAHAARPWLGDNPIPRLNAALDKLTAKFAEWETDTAHRWHPTCTVTDFGTDNDAFNRLPGEAHATLDIRFPPPFSIDQLLATIRETLGATIEVEPIITAEPTHLSPDPRFVEITKAVTGDKVELVQESGGSDARFLHPHGIPVLMSRPLVGNLHAPDEWIDIDSMVTYYRICETYLAERLGVELPSDLGPA
ncbi:MAG: M20/M25/M40 family metallo-hydrolase [Synoicihabitans sp.]